MFQQQGNDWNTSFGFGTGRFVIMSNMHLERCRVSFHTGTGNIVPRLVTDLTDFFGENKEFSMILGKNWNFKVVFD